MAARQLSDARSDGVKLGQSVTDKVGFWGKTPIVQPAHTDQGAITAGATTTAANNLLIQVRLALVNSGLMKGSN
jgi:hypothetical protein